MERNGNMKKIVSIILICLLMVLTCALAEDAERTAEPGVFTEEEAAPYIGEWYLTQFVTEGTIVAPESMGFIGHLMLYADGTGQMIIGSTVVDQVWYRNGDEIMLGEGHGYDMPMYIQENGDLFTGDDIASMTFTRRFREDDPAIRLDAETDDFKGDWKLVRIAKGENVYTPEELDCEISLTLKKDGYVSVTNGKKAKGDLEQTAYSLANAGTRFVLHEDGSLSCENSSFILWFVKE